MSSLQQITDIEFEEKVLQAMMKDFLKAQKKK
mgnify:CR=1 FL=1